MKPEKMTVLEVFQRERRLCVPLFQRAYVWNSEQQWEPLWEDIVRQANMHMAQTDPRAISTHFLGAIVINIASVQGRSRCPSRRHRRAAATYYAPAIHGRSARRGEGARRPIPTMLTRSPAHREPTSRQDIR